MYEKMLNQIKESGRTLILYCASRDGESVLDYVEKLNMIPTCFCDNDPIKDGCKSFGYHIHNYGYCKEHYKTPIYLITNMLPATSAVIERQLRADGLSKNEDFFIFSEYVMEFTKEHTLLTTVLESRDIILVGSPILAKFFVKSLQHRKCICKHITFLKTPFANEQDYNILEDSINAYEINMCKKLFPKASYLILYKELSDADSAHYTEKLLRYLKQEGIYNISNHFYSEYPYIEEILECRESPSIKNNIDERHKRELAIEDFDSFIQLYDSYYSGSTLLGGIFDGHSNIIAFTQNDMFLDNLWFYIQRIKGFTVNEIPKKLAEYHNAKVKNSGTKKNLIQADKEKKFVAEFIKAVDGRTILSEKDIYVAALIAVFYSNGREYTSNKKPIIFYDFHINSSILPIMQRWISINFSNYILLQPVRNTISRLGSKLRAECGYFSGRDLYNCWKKWLRYIPSWGNNQIKKELEGHIIRFRFEDLKLHPKELLSILCDKIGISWSDTLLETTAKGADLFYNVRDSYSVTGFDLKPIYNQYTEFFSSFDRFRLEILFSERQEAYGYDTIDTDFYKFDEQWIRDLYQYPFKFEESYAEYISHEEWLETREQIYEACLCQLDMLNHKQEMEKYFNFGEYIHL